MTRILILHRKKNLKLIVNEIIAADEIWVMGRQTPEMKKQIKLARLTNIPVFYNPINDQTMKRLFGGKK